MHSCVASSFSCMIRSSGNPLLSFFLVPLVCSVLFYCAYAKDSEMFMNLGVDVNLE